MAIQNNRLPEKDYAENFSDIHPPFETAWSIIANPSSTCSFVIQSGGAIKI